MRKKDQVNTPSWQQDTSTIQEQYKVRWTKLTKLTKLTEQIFNNPNEIGDNDEKKEDKKRRETPTSDVRNGREMLAKMDGKENNRTNIKTQQR